MGDGMRLLMLVMAALLVTSAASNAAENPVNGNVFLRTFCSKPDDPDVAALGYIHGFDNGAAVALSLAGKKDVLPYCVPDGVTYGQMGRVLCRYLVDNPNHTHESMAVLTAAALAKAWPCKTP